MISAIALKPKTYLTLGVLAVLSIIIFVWPLIVNPESFLSDDAQALNISQLSGGSKTATEINAAYEALDLKTTLFEYQVLDFLEGIFALAGIEDNATFKRSRIVNQLEETQMVMLAAEHLDEETLLNKLSWLTPEEVSNILENKAGESLNRFGAGAEV